MSTIEARKRVIYRVLVFLAVFSMMMGSGWFMGLSHAQDTVEGYKVDHGIVCMVTDKVMGRPQIPVVVGGKTYYGCCKNCVGKLKGNPAIRYAKDPVTGAQVDKARAFIMEGPNGDALYFESALTARRFVESMKR